MGHLTMSSKEAPRPGLLKAVLKGKVTNLEVARALKLSVRQVRRLRRRYEQAGLKGLVHRLRGRPSNRRLGPPLRERVIALMTTAYAGLNNHWSLEEQLAGRQRPTQLGQAFEELGIRYIPAGTPQAKGRIERLWGTLHDRLTAELNLAGITTVEAALAFAPSFLDDFHRRFTVPARDPRPIWRRPLPHLDHSLACRYRRVVARDSTVSIPGRLVRLPPRCCTPGTSVEIRELLDGRLLVLRHHRLIAQEPAPVGPFVLTPRDEARRRRRLASLGIDLQGSPTSHNLPSAHVRPSTPAPPKPKANSRPPRPPSADHPWRRSYHSRSSPLNR